MSLLVRLEAASGKLEISPYCFATVLPPSVFCLVFVVWYGSVGSRLGISPERSTFNFKNDGGPQGRNIDEDLLFAVEGRAF